MVDRITAEAPIHQFREAALAGGMVSLLADAMAKARAGIIPLTEVERVAPYRMMAESAAPSG